MRKRQKPGKIKRLMIRQDKTPDTKRQQPGAIISNYHVGLPG